MSSNKSKASITECVVLNCTYQQEFIIYIMNSCYQQSTLLSITGIAMPLFVHIPSEKLEYNVRNIIECDVPIDIGQ